MMHRPPLVAWTTRRIAELNDLARMAMGIRSRVLQTPGITAFPPDVQSRIRQRVETFDAFTPANDPFHEHDFGAIEVDGHDVFWKIEYYNPTLTTRSADPSDPTQTIRVLTIMLAQEY